MVPCTSSSIAALVLSTDFFPAAAAARILKIAVSRL